MGLKEPFNSISHMVGAALGIAGLVVLVIMADGALEVVSATLYGFGLIAVFGASSTYHALPVGPKAEMWLERIDHVAIYLLIAGTYTPVCLIMIGGAWGWSLFGVVWGISTVGIVLALAVPLGPTWLHIAGYIGLGWVAVVGAPVLLKVLTGWMFFWLLGGGIIYTVGALFYVWDKPNLIGKLGAHEIWHLFVLAAAGAHFVFIIRYVL